MILHQQYVTVNLESEFLPWASKPYAMSTISIVKLDQVRCISLHNFVVEIRAVQYFNQIGVLVQADESSPCRQDAESHGERNHHDGQSAYGHHHCSDELLADVCTDLHAPL